MAFRADISTVLVLLLSIPCPSTAQTLLSSGNPADYPFIQLEGSLRPEKLHHVRVDFKRGHGLRFRLSYDHKRFAFTAFDSRAVMAIYRDQRFILSEPRDDGEVQHRVLRLVRIKPAYRKFKILELGALVALAYTEIRYGDGPNFLRGGLFATTTFLGVPLCLQALEPIPFVKAEWDSKL